MDRGLRGLPDTHQPTYHPLAPITLFFHLSLFSRLHFFPPPILIPCAAVRKKNTNLASFLERSRWDVGREGRAENLSGVGVVYPRRAVLFSSQPRTLGAPISPREAQGCAFNQAGRGLAQHNQSRITGGEDGEAGGGR